MTFNKSQNGKKDTCRDRNRRMHRGYDRSKNKQKSIAKC